MCIAAFAIVEPSAAEYLRRMQLTELKGPVVDFNEEGIVTYRADFVKIFVGAETVGYACIGTYEYYKNIVLEYYVTNRYRSEACTILKELVKQFCCRGWFVNTHDFFALPVLLELRLPFEVDAYQFEAVGTAADETFDCAVTLEATKHEETEEVYQLIMQDGFYTGGGIETLKPRIDVKELYSLRENGRLIGVGFIGVLVRTPKYADIAMIIDKPERKNGWGARLVQALINKCRELGIKPAAVCSADNPASRRTLQNAGFGMNGCILLARFK